MLPQYSFGKNFKTIITGKEAWKEGPSINADIACYTDGSKTEEGVGAGINITEPKTKVSLSSSKKVTIFQAETAAIRHCAEKLLRQEFKEKTIAIYSDSQAAIKAISSMQVNSKLVWNCLEKLQELGSQNKLSLAWVPGHTGYKGNEEADSLAREGARRSLIGPEPSCGTAKALQKTCNSNWKEKQSQKWWNEAPGMRQAKEFIKEPSPKFTEYLLNLNRRATRVLVGPLTEHCRINKHMNNIGLADTA
ncbi:ribonuclease H-like [Leptinotarsa decemlineata]|uniref:ribonuclease H-like n=1 Tax=Leptinotarsa decemlineata TaxID=7539 RepID=UPI003D3075B9